MDSTLIRQAEGTGIGLSLVKVLVDAMEGHISVRSKVGQGSCFSIKLPDKTLADEEIEPMRQELSDDRLVQAIAIEFSDIYVS